MGITKLIPGVHFVRETWFVKTLRRQLRYPNLVTYYDRLLNTWLLGNLVDKTKMVVDEIDELGPTLENLDWKLLEALKRSRQPMLPGSLKAKKLYAEKEAARKLTEKQAEEAEFKTWWRRRGGQPVYFQVPVNTGGGELLSTRRIQ